MAWIAPFIALGPCRPVSRPIPRLRKYRRFRAPGSLGYWRQSDLPHRRPIRHEGSRGECIDCPSTRGTCPLAPDLGRTPARFTDGPSGTLPAAEVKVPNPYSRRVGGLADFGLSGAPYTPGDVPPPPADPPAVVPEYGGTCGAVSLSPGGSHTAWVDGNAHGAGMTTAWPPNKQILDPGRSHDVDPSGTPSFRGGPTFAAIAARGFHPGGVHAPPGDGSVRFVKSGVAGATWRAPGPVNGGEAVGDAH